MAVQQKQNRWVEVPQVGTQQGIRVKLETVDLGNGDAVVPAIRFGREKGKHQALGQLGSRPQAGPVSYLVSVADLKELVRLAEEQPEALGGE